MNKKRQHTIMDVHSLHNEIDRLYDRKAEIENELSGNWTYFKQDYPRIIRRSIFRKAGGAAGFSFLETLVNMPKVKESIGKVSEKISTGLGDVLLKWFDKIAK